MSTWHCPCGTDNFAASKICKECDGSRREAEMRVFAAHQLRRLASDPQRRLRTADGDWVSLAAIMACADELAPDR